MQREMMNKGIFKDEIDSKDFMWALGTLAVLIYPILWFINNLHLFATTF